MELLLKKKTIYGICILVSFGVMILSILLPFVFSGSRQPISSGDVITIERSGTAAIYFEITGHLALRYLHPRAETVVFINTNTGRVASGQRPSVTFTYSIGSRHGTRIANINLSPGEWRAELPPVLEQGRIVWRMHSNFRFLYVFAIFAFIAIIVFFFLRRGQKKKIKELILQESIRNEVMRELMAKKGYK